VQSGDKSALTALLLLPLIISYGDLNKQWVNVIASLTSTKRPEVLANRLQLLITMDAIKNKMKSLKTETENAMAKANELETEAKEANQRADRNEEQVRDLQKKMQHVENDLDQTLEKLQSTTNKLDEKDKAFQVAEAEIQALQRKLTLTEDELKRSESKLTTTSADLSVASNRRDEIARAIKVLETKNMVDESSEYFIG
jgi:chromosome segregation ATPase